jgi:endonuclease-3
MEETKTRRQAHHARARRLLGLLEAAHPEATCALAYGSPFELLVATILSAQCTDERVNAVTPTLFQRFPAARDLARAELSELERLIHSTGFFRAKAKSLVACAQALVARHGGEVPPDMEELVRLPGIGRKTANVVLGHAFGVAAGIVVDTHVLRVANRLGLARSESPEETERALTELWPRSRWTAAGDVLIFHGRKVCAARRPRCGECPVAALCRWPGRSGPVARKPRRPRPAPRPSR